MAGWKSAPCGERCLVKGNMEVYHEEQSLYLRCRKGCRRIECSVYLDGIRQFYVSQDKDSVFVTVADGRSDEEQNVTIALTEKGIIFV